MERQIEYVHCGRTSYEACSVMQHRLADRRIRGEAADTLLLTEHDHVYTIGTTGSELHLLARPDELLALGASVCRTDRGGDITYHGPGQLVVYPILDLQGYTPDLHRYVRGLEEVVIGVLARYGIPAGRIDGKTGVWCRGEKICAIGIRSKQWVTMHGFALNVNTDLAYFSRIIPCGIFDRGVTSMGDVLGSDVDMAEVEQSVIREFGTVFGATMAQGSTDEMPAPAESIAE